jgi:hypothetical protein
VCTIHGTHEYTDIVCLLTEEVIEKQSRYVVYRLVQLPNLPIFYIATSKPMLTSYTNTTLYRAFLKGGEKLARPGVISAGKQSAFREDRQEIPSAFGDETPSSEGSKPR